MKENRFIIITTAHNVHPWIINNITSTQFQSYKNFFHLIIADKCTDTTVWVSHDIINKTAKDRLHQEIICTPENRGGSQGDAFMFGIEYLEKNNLIQDEDIIVEVDGDDWFASNFVLQHLNMIYQDPEVWMTHGQYMIYPSGKVGGHYNWHVSNKDVRNNPFPYSHLKTYKYWLFNKIDRNDLIDSTTGKIFSAAWDHALCIPMVEMANEGKHIKMCEDILYVLNRSEELQNEGKIRTSNQKEVEQRIRKQKPYDSIRSRSI